VAVTSQADLKLPGLQGQLVAVSAGASGIGLSIAGTLAAQGARMAIHGVIAARATQMGVSIDEMRARYVSRISLRRMTPPENVAWMATFLISQAGRNLSGQSFPVDGNVENLWRKPIR
jgi:NAD(P)-dependent dehydrogenase (short-subunit alcohol dehydrogenase family)